MDEFYNQEEDFERLARQIEYNNMYWQQYEEYFKDVDNDN